MVGQPLQATYTFVIFEVNLEMKKVEIVYPPLVLPTFFLVRGYILKDIVPGFSPKRVLQGVGVGGITWQPSPEDGGRGASSLEGCKPSTFFVL